MIVPLNNDNGNEVYLFFSPRRCITNSLSREETTFTTCRKQMLWEGNYFPWSPRRRGDSTQLQRHL